MESKSEAKGGGGGADSKGEDGHEVAGLSMSTAPPTNIVIRFTEFAMKVLNQDMDDFFEDHVQEFDQDDEELRSGAGETLQQYEVYQQYVAALEGHFDGCVRTEDTQRHRHTDT